MKFKTANYARLMIFPTLVLGLLIGGLAKNFFTRSHIRMEIQDFEMDELYTLEELVKNNNELFFERYRPSVFPPWIKSYSYQGTSSMLARLDYSDKDRTEASFIKLSLGDRFIYISREE